MILQEKPDLVLLDVCMPTVSGDTLVKLFARAAPNSKTIVLLYSALDEPLLRSKVKASGAQGYVSKASGPAGLLRTVKHWLRHSPSQQRMPRVLEATLLSKLPGPQTSATRRRVDVPNIPIPESTTAAMSPAMPRRTSGAFSLDDPTVLFVDDEMLILSAYRRVLQGQPFQFEFALSGAQALRILSSDNPPRVVVSDLRMPDPDGKEVLRKALDLDESWSRRFVIVTGQPLNDAKKQLDPRFCGYVLSKPVAVETLTSAILASLQGTGSSALIAAAR
jgi:CheY-like chemotaxis protein